MSTIFCCLSFLLVQAQTTDLPNPTPNFQTLPSGSYVIAMDNTLQVNSSGSFNLNAYGLVVYLLNNNVRVKWSIKAGKAKDGVDFTANAEQIKPSLAAGGVSRNFKAGPFVIFAADTMGVASLVDAFYSVSSLTGLNRPQVYRLTQDAANVDIRYDLTAFRPKAAVLTDGANQGIHLAYMAAASIPAESYATSQGADLLTNCFTFASEPHNNKAGAAVDNAISAIRDFVTKGGNFLAQCDAVDNYENNTLGRFQTTNGISKANANIGTALSYANPDLSFSQFEGVYNGASGGSFKNWEILGAPKANEHNHATGTGGNANIIAASVSKHYYDKGGLVFYIGNHSFSTTTTDGINGIRMYMNAFLTPSNTNCPVLVSIPLNVHLTQFSVSSERNTTNLQWTVTNNELAGKFVVEKRVTGNDFVPVGVVTATGTAGTQSYSFSEARSATKTFYRIKFLDQQGRSAYSWVVATRSETSAPYLSVLYAGDRDALLAGYFSNSGGYITLRVYNFSGAVVYSGKERIVEGMNILAIPGYCVSARGLYFLEAVSQDGLSLKAKLPRF